MIAKAVATATNTIEISIEAITSMSAGSPLVRINILFSKVTSSVSADP
jgi:hypothetical protein